MINEIKIAEIVQMTCEEAEENNFVLLCQEGEVRADVVEVECELDEEVAQLTQLMDLQTHDPQSQLPVKVGQ